MSRIRIGVTQNFMHADPERPLFRGKTLQYVEARMVKSVWRSGAVPVPVVDLEDDDALGHAVEEIDGLLLTGGADVAPQSYGETPLKPAWGGDAHRDAYERRLVELSLAAGKPVFGLCRGIQLLNVALGGTLYQDIQTQIEGSLVHRDWHRYDDLGHDIRIDAGSAVGKLYGGASELAVNSIHHQALKELGEGLTATAWAPDGIVEAVQDFRDGRWILGVQWHPEWLEPDRVQSDEIAKGWADGRVLFDAFIEACRDRRR
jgi:putative glutamine amidotransferase